MSTVTPFDLLPPELWELIFSLTPLDKSLLTLALVCHAFNRRCIHHYLRRCTVKRLSLDDVLSEEQLVLGSKSTAALTLLASEETLVAEELSYRDTTYKTDVLLRNLTRLATVVRRAPKLRVLSVKLALDVLASDPNDEQEQILDVLFGIISTFTKTAHQTETSRASAVVLAEPGTMFSCPLAEVAKWVRDKPIVPFEARVLPWWCCLQARPGKLQPKPLEELNSVEIRFTETTASNLISFNKEQIHLLRFQHDAQLPKLREILLGRPLDPSHFRTFLSNHPRLRTIEHTSNFVTRQVPSTTNPERPLVDPPFAHPNLTRLRTRCITTYGHHLSIVAGLVHSPKLEVLEYILDDANGPAEHARFIADLHALSARSKPIDLVLHLPGFAFMDANWIPAKTRTSILVRWTTEPAAIAAARELHCVRHVYLTVQSVMTGHKVVQWLRNFPALERLRVGFWRGGDKMDFFCPYTPVQRAFIAETRASLPYVHVTTPAI
ncbi:hypothetical protein HMN09_00380500 [Mycena chlorophos]|uniref:F-box domain-containing protein n=1 Tax=Mycena chlorophos TaxID=658473 RepID=A0A8H6TH90_MYCCL|nr:hypothetical protein HMN09_00380500 [Mycena chlorophos]